MNVHTAQRRIHAYTNTGCSVLTLGYPGIVLFLGSHVELVKACCLFYHGHTRSLHFGLIGYVVWMVPLLWRYFWCLGY